MYSTSPRSVSGQESSYGHSSLSESEEISLNAPEFMTDEFRMKHFKIDKCPKLHAHDWTTCPLAHPGEKARRRNPEEFKYAAIACIDMKNNGHCPRGDDCPYAHNVFEYWMHPTRYRTQICNDGTKCKRQICFFAHRLEELRVPPRKPGFPPEWNKGRKHKNRGAHSKKKVPSPQNESGCKGVSEPVIKISSGLHHHVGQTISMKSPRPTTAHNGHLHQQLIGSVMQDAGSVTQQRNAVHCVPMSSATGHNLCQVQFNEYIADQQHNAVQSDTQTSQGLQYFASKLERALCCPGVDLGLEQKDQISDKDECVPAPCGGVFEFGRMNPDLFVDMSTGYDALSVSMPKTGSTLSSPATSQIHSPQKTAPFPGMGSDIGSPMTPSFMDLSPLRLEQSLYNYHPYGNQSLFYSNYRQPFAY